jgi:predicted dehydrogenase
LLNQGIYSVTISHMLLGQPSRVEAAGQMRADGVDLSGHFTLEYPDGRFAHGASSMVEFLDQSASVGGTLGWISIDAFFWFASTLTVHRYGASGYTATPHQVATEGNGYVPMLRAVTEAIADGLREHPLHTLDETARIFDSLDEIRSQFTSMGGD